MDDDLAEKYRPRTFEEVWGQEYPVKFLSGLILRGQATRAILLHGAFGSGKTSLAHVYAKALNCYQPSATGSACQSCSACAQPNGHILGLQVYDVSGREGSKDEIMGWLGPLIRDRPEYKRQIIFFDEAHRLERAASDALLKIIEDRPDWLAFIFATTEPGWLRRTLVSRLDHLEVWPLANPLAIEFLKYVAKREGIAAETEALALLAGLKQGHARDLLIGLDQAQKADGVVTLERVRSTFGVDFSEVLTKYFLVLAEGDAAQQINVFLAWREPVPDKVKWVQAFATTLYYRYICRFNIVTDALTASIPEREVRPIIDAFCTRLDVDAVEGLAEAWRAMIQFLAKVPSDANEVTLNLWIPLYHDFINNEMPALTERTESQKQIVSHKEGSAVLPAPPRAEKIAERSTKLSSESSSATRLEDRFIDVEDVREIINTASFLVQEYGLYFNLSIVLRADLFDRVNQTSSFQLIEQFGQELEKQVTDWCGRVVFARVTLYELYEAGYRGLLVVRLPTSNKEGFGSDCLEKAKAWCASWRANERTVSTAEAVQFKHARGQAERAFHWRETLNLCAGLRDREIAVDQEGNEQPLLQLLGIARPRWHEVGPLRLPAGDRPFSTSALLKPEAIERASRYNMKPLSAFDDKAWDQLRRGWEMEEYKDRYEVREERRREVERQRRVHGSSPPIVDNWSPDPHDRVRNWQVWWQARSD